ncbi:nuclear transport factor 2 family protein [Sorangium sp. So ce1097]|uniref:nuclear transport factor 2 family protein n=1 Tax=Sorangium sp. So ce1097 TaxID=3133330 RepID=UPI003F5E0608
MKQQSRVTAEAIKNVFAAFERSEAEVLALLAELYHPEVEFRDPIQEVRGRDAFIEANRRLIRRAQRICFVVHDVVESGDRIVATWRFSLLTRVGPELQAEAMSYMALRDGLIVRHRDYWDPAGAVLVKIPGVSALYRKLLGTLA